MYSVRYMQNLRQVTHFHFCHTLVKFYIVTMSVSFTKGYNSQQ